MAKTRNWGGGSAVMNQALKISGTLDQGIGADLATLEITGSVLIKGDLQISGSIYARQRDVKTHKADWADADGKKYLKFDAHGDLNNPNAHTKLIAPAAGSLKQVLLRVNWSAMETGPGVTIVGFHKSSNGTENINTTATTSALVTVTNANTTYAVDFDDNAWFSKGDVLGISLDPEDAMGVLNVTSVWEFFYESHDGH